MATFPHSINQLSALLDKRQLTAAEGVLMGLAIVPTPDARGDLGFIPGGRIKHLERLPYFDLTGNPIKDPKLGGTEFVRYRIERPDDWMPTPKGTLGADGRPIKDAKYLSPKDSATFVYLPRIDGLVWSEVAANPDIPVIITEGEFKAYTLSKSGTHTVGLTGVQGFGKNGEPLPYPLSEFSHLGREYWIAFDADSESDYENPLKVEVAQAAMRLASKLAMLGAKPYLLHIARTDTFQKARAKDSECKLGVDDYLFSGGSPEELIATKTLAVNCLDMAELRSKYAYYAGENPHIVNIQNGSVYKTTSFVKELEAPRIRLVERKNGAPLQVSVANEFVHARDRPTIDRKVFWPQAPMGYDAEARTYNEWRGWKVEGLVQMGEGEQYNEVVAIWKKLIKGLFGEHDWYFEKWLAHLFQRPGEKTTIGIILASPLTGIGKSLLGEVIRGMVGGDSSVAIELDRAMKDFNALLNRKIFVQMDEAEGKFAGYESKLKDMVTADTAVIEKKGWDSVVVDNYCRIFMTSNSPSPIRLNREERRMFVACPTVTKAQILAEWGPWVSDVVAKRLKSATGLRMLRWYLDKVDLTGWDPCARVIMTEAAWEMVGAGKTKSNTTMEGLWEAFLEEESGWWALTPATRSRDGSLWGAFIARLISEGGRTCYHKGKIVGNMCILDRERALPVHRPPSAEQWMLDNKGLKIEGEVFLASSKKVDALLTKWLDTVLPSGKY